MKPEPIVIIGAGIGGLSAAIRLAAAGRRVVVLEQNEQVGGKMGQWQQDGYRWDTGPSVITMRHVFDDLFASAGRRLEEYLTLLPLDPLTRYFYPDGTRLDATSDWSRMAAQIAALDERDVEGYLAFLRYAAQLHRITGPVFIYDQPPTVRSFLRVPPLDWLKVDAWRSMQGKIEGFVRSPQLRQLFGRFATYVGGSPYQAPATLNVIAHVELTGGVFYPQGGIYQIAAAMARLAAELDVEIQTSTPVEQLLLDTSRSTPRVTGVRLADGREIATRTVLSNVDVATTFNRLLPASVADGALKRLTRVEPSCSGFILMLGVEGEHPEVAHHNIWFSADYRREFQQIFADGHPPDDPTIYAAITSKTDAQHAPSGCENWFILVNAPALDARTDWTTSAPAYRDRILATLAARGVDLRGKIRAERMLTPLDLQNTTGAHRGALYGASPNNPLTAFLRPHNRSRDVNGLYFAGGTTHPGGGVPMVTLSGQVAANMILRD
jgi:phytoene desaturase